MTGLNVKRFPENSDGGNNLTAIGVEVGSGGYGILRVSDSGQVFAPANTTNEQTVKSGNGVLIRVLTLDALAGNVTITVDSTTIVIPSGTAQATLFQLGITYSSELKIELATASDYDKIILVYE